jgi:predicted house-cleaning noncanonical NTP pyrophosphatase (MazG superfamily)
LQEKLVRDRIPEIIRERGEVPKVRVAENHEVDYLIRRKVVEEAQELLQSSNEEEIADILEALEALLEHRGIDWSAIEEIRTRKKVERGGFEKRFVLETDG